MTATPQEKNRRRLLSGNEAVAHGAYAAGLRVACAYPGTPSTEILETLARFPAIDAQWSVNEKVAYEVALSAAIGGVRSLYASKHVGLNVAMDPLMTSAYTGVNAGFVAVVCDDPGLHSSQNEQDTRWVAIYAKLPLIEPAGPAETHEYIQTAFEVSEEFDTPILFRMTTRIAHSKEDVIPATRVEITPREFEINPAKYVMVPRNALERHKVLEERIEKLRQYSESTPMNRVELQKRRLGFITDGVSYFYLKELFPDASFLKLGFVYPFCDAKIRAFAAKVDELMVVEELDSFIEEHVHALGIQTRTKHPSFHVGELRPEDMPALVDGKARSDHDSHERRPVLCPGCSHRFTYVATRKLNPIVSGDIGCYTLGAAAPLSALHTCLCMGAGITFHEGLRRALQDKNIIGVVGDSTFLHSGITGLINAAYNAVHGVLMILDNSTTAMTGMQPHAATGKNIHQQPARRIILEDLCKACGADNVDVVNPLNVAALRTLLEKRLAQEELSVIIAREPCWQTTHKRDPIPDFIEDNCRKCYLCLDIDCPALSKREDGLIALDPTLCTGCNLCVMVCPFDALVKHNEQSKQE